MFIEGKFFLHQRYTNKVEYLQKLLYSLVLDGELCTVYSNTGGI